MTRTINDLGSHVASRYPFQSRFANVNGWRMHYVDEGPREAPPMLLLHGNPTWGYLWRDTVPPLLAAGYRVIVSIKRPAPTLPIRQGNFDLLKSCPNRNERTGHASS